MASEKKKNKSGPGRSKSSSKASSKGSTKGSSKRTTSKRPTSKRSGSNPRPKGSSPAGSTSRSGGSGSRSGRAKAKGGAAGQAKSSGRKPKSANSTAKSKAKSKTKSSAHSAQGSSSHQGSQGRRRRSSGSGRGPNQRGGAGRRGQGNKANQGHHRSTNRRRVDRHSERSEVGQAFDAELMADYYGYTKQQLEEIIENGETPDVGSMEGYVYRGMNIGKLAKLGGVQKFAKGFFFSKYYEEDGIFNFGYNIPVVQNGIENEWELKMAGKEPKRFGFYRVYAVNPASRDSKYPNALLLNYKCRLNKWYDPTQGLRDYVVRINPGSDDLLLGKAYYAIGARVLAGFFILHRYQPTDYTGPLTH